MAIGKPIRPDGHFALLSDHFALLSGHFALLSGHFALLSDQGDRDALENRRSQVSCKHFEVPSTMSPHAHLARSPVGLADKVWLEAVGREPGENSPWYRSHVLAQRPKLASETLIPQEWLNLALSDATAAAVQTLRAGAPIIGKVRLGCDVGEGVGRSQSVIVVRVQPSPSFLPTRSESGPPAPDKNWGEVYAGGANRIRYQWGRHLKMTPEQLS